MILQLKNIHKTYQQGKMDVPVLNNISMDIERGDYVAIMGPSGSGKTTLMNLIGCLDYPSAGEYYLDGENVLLGNDSKLSDVRLNSIGFVFQSFHLLPRQSALENVALPLLYAGVKKRERLAIAYEALARVGLADRTDFKPTQLSGGQCQRVAIARAIVNKPKILLADEPTGALDTVSGEQIMELFQSLNTEGVTVIMITHEREIALHAKTIFYIRDGRLVDADGRFIQPKSDFTAPGDSGIPVPQDQYPAVPEIPAALPVQTPEEPVKPESAMPDTLPAAAPPEPQNPEQPMYTVPQAGLSGKRVETAVREQKQHILQSSADKPVQTEKTVKTERAVTSPALSQSTAIMQEKAVQSKTAVKTPEKTVRAAASVPVPGGAEKPQQSFEVPQSYEEIDEREQSLRMDLDALMSRVIGDRAPTQQQPVTAIPAAPPVKKSPAAAKPVPASMRKSVKKPEPAPEPAAPAERAAAAKPEPKKKPVPVSKPMPDFKPAPARGGWSSPMGKPAAVFAFEKNGQFERPIKIDLGGTDMGNSPWLFNSRGD